MYSERDYQQATSICYNFVLINRARLLSRNHTISYTRDPQDYWGMGPNVGAGKVSDPFQHAVKGRASERLIA